MLLSVELWVLLVLRLGRVRKIGLTSVTWQCKRCHQENANATSFTRQHQGVEAGKPFEQLVNAGMKTTQLDQIVRQREAPELLKAVEHLSRGEVAEGVALLEQQGRVTEIADAQQRIAAIARTRTTPSSSRPTMPRAVRSIRPCVPNCKP
jgi:hypothetical protein